MLLRCPIQSLRAVPAVLALAAVWGFATPASAQYSWDQPVNGFYDVATNWRPSQVPGAGNTATLALAGGYTVTLRDDRSIDNFTILVNPNAVLSHTAGTYSVTGTINLGAGRYDLNGGTISGGTIVGGGGRLALANNAANRLHNVSSIEVGTLNFSAAGARVLFSGSTATAAGTTLNLTNNNILGIERTATVSSLTVNLGSANQFSYLSVEGNNTLTLASSVTINATGWSDIGSGQYTAGSSRLVNQGLIEKTIANTNLWIHPSGGFENRGTVRVAANGGQVYITSGGTINTATGSLQVLANGLMQIDGTGWVNAGALVVNGGTANLLGTNWANNGTTSLTDGTLNLGGSTTTAGLGLGGLTRAGTTTVNLIGQIDNSNTSLAITATTGTLRLFGGTVTGGAITAAGGANLLVGAHGSNRLQDVVVGVGALSFAETGGHLLLSGTTLEAGTLLDLVNNNFVGFEQTAPLHDLTINLGNVNQFSYLSAEGNQTLTLGPSVVVNAAGFADIGSNYFVGGQAGVVNQGLIEKTEAGTDLWIHPSGGFTNQGVVRVAADGGTVYISSGGVINTGLLEVLTNGTLEIDGTNWVNQGAIHLDGGTLNLGGSTTTAGLGLGGLTRAGTTTVNLMGQLDNTNATLAITAATGSLRLNGGTITGGSLTAAGGEVLLVGANSSNRLDGVQVGPGALSFAEAGGTLRVSGGTTFAPGETFHLTNSNFLAFEQTTLIDGTINLGNAAQYSYLTVEGDHTLTLSGTVNITGLGQISSNQLVGGTGTVVNQGVIEKSLPGAVAYINPVVFTNDGTLRVAADGGTLLVAAGTNLTNYTNNTLTGGTWEVHDNAVLDFDGRTIATITGGATVVLNGPNSTFDALNTLTTIDTATLSVRGGRNFTPTGGSLTVVGTGESTSGVLAVGAGSRVTANVLLGNISLLTGSGTVDGNVTAGSNSMIVPELNGPLTVTDGNVLFNGGSTSTFRVFLNGSTNAGTDYSQLVVDTPGSVINLNNAVLDAQLGFAPFNHEKLFIIDNQTGSHVLGTFAGLGQGDPVPGTPFFISYTGDNLTGSLTGGNDVVLYNPVPEPAHVLALAAAGAGVVGWVRRRRQATAS